MSSLRHTRHSFRISRWARAFAPLAALALGLTLSGLLAPVAFTATADHLVISEFMVKTRNPVSTFGSPFIEVVNPTTSPIDMSHVYITDGTTGTSAAYYKIALRDLVAGNPGGGGLDFHAKFPAGFTLAAGASVVISINGSDEYSEAYGRQPDFELFEDGLAVDAVPELEPAFPGAIEADLTSQPVLSDVAESLVLYSWDGESDHVQDLDYVMWGSNESVRVDKTGVTIGSHTYLADTAVGNQIPVAGSGPNFGHSFQRVSADEGAEVPNGGNGVTGHDETSENLDVTWADVAPADPAPGLANPFPAAPRISNLANGTAVDGIDISVTAVVEDPGSVTQVVFYYSVDGGDYTSLTGSLDGGQQWSATIPGQAMGAQVAIYCTARNQAGGVAVYPGGAPAFIGEIFTVESPFSGPQKLLITEVCVGPNIYPFTGMEQLAQEFIEIFNPNDFDVDLSYYHLTDAIRYGSEYYWLIAEGLLTQGDIGGGHYNDFVARFPAGYTLPARSTITISMAGSDWFEAAYGELPDLEMYEDGAEADAVPDMEPVFTNPPSDTPGNSIYTEGRSAGSDDLPRGIPELEEHYGEPLILYYFRPGDDLVVDVDVFIWGEEKTGQFGYGFEKGRSDNNSADYAPDTPLSEQDWHTDLDESGTVSFTRIDPDEGSQTATGGNGVAGRDETSENLSVTFALETPTPGTFLAGELIGAVTVPKVVLAVPARTFNPYQGEVFPVSIAIPAADESVESPFSNHFELRLRVFDREGRLVTTLWDSRFDTGLSNYAELPTVINWDGRNDTYEQVKAGMYILHMSYVDPLEGEEVTQTAPVVVATQLSN
jgi:hypothetical protein